MSSVAHQGSVAATTHATTQVSHAVATKAAAGGVGKLGSAGVLKAGSGLGSLFGAGSAAGGLVVPAAIGAIAANLLVGSAFLVAHSAGLRQLPSKHSTPLAGAPAVSPVASQLSDQLALLTSLEHVQLTPAQATQFLHAWAGRTEALISLSGVRAAVRVFAADVQAELDRLSALLPTGAITSVRKSVTNAVTALPLLGSVGTPSIPGATGVPTVAPSTGSTVIVTPTPTSPTQLPSQLPTGVPTTLPTQLPVPTPTVPDVQLPGINVGPIQVPPLTIAGVSS